MCIKCAILYTWATARQRPCCVVHYVCFVSTICIPHVVSERKWCGCVHFQKVLSINKKGKQIEITDVIVHLEGGNRRSSVHVHKRRKPQTQKVSNKVTSGFTVSAESDSTRLLHKQTKISVPRSGTASRREINLNFKAALCNIVLDLRKNIFFSLWRTTESDITVGPW